MGIETPIMFPANLNHGDMAIHHEVVAAGFCIIQPDKSNLSVSCFGKSVTLKIDSRKEKDAAIIHRELTRWKD
jgi:hypothetical protein